MDFGPEEGDRIKLPFLELRKRNLIEKGKIKVNRKGVVILTLLDGEVLPLVNINRTDLTASLNQRKGKFELAFKTRF